MYHRPVMLRASLEGLNIKPEGVYVDATFGGGGHSRAILDQLTGGRLFAFDQDEAAERNVPDDPRITFLNHNFRHMGQFLRYYGMEKIDGILADLGVSSHQFDSAERGFSTRFPGPLDMRMDQNSGLSAREVINTYDTESLARLFRLYGELRGAYRIAATIEKSRSDSEITTTEQLQQIVMPHAPKGRENKFFAQVFQALRIEVNQELDALQELLNQSIDSLATGGRLVIISYHSLEDRLVKNVFRAGNVQGVVEKDFFGNPIVPFLPVGKSKTPDPEETLVNPRSRSARLRVAERTPHVGFG